MIRLLVILLVGLGAGYFVGFKDAQKHRRNVVERTVERVGGANRGKYDMDLDKRAASQP